MCYSNYFDLVANHHVYKLAESVPVGFGRQTLFKFYLGFAIVDPQVINIPNGFFEH